MIWIGIEDQQNLPWAFPLFGSPGFINSNNGETIEIDLAKHHSVPPDWLSLLKEGKPIGCLVIELASRRRVRINGLIRRISKEQLQIDIRQSYPNCPKYIRKRNLLGTLEFSQLSLVARGELLTEKLENIISQSDTAFVASNGPNGADVSHRGGSRGFLTSEIPGKIRVPDYKGNGMFNTLGNFQVNPVAGLTIVEFNQGYFLQVSGAVALYIGQETSESVSTEFATNVTNRYWELVIHQWRLFKLEANFEWESLDFSPYNP
jgi:hypothetical protein